MWIIKGVIMQTISLNRISQGQHGTSKAVDISGTGNVNRIIYAPEDGTIDSYQRRGSGVNDAGNALRQRSGSRLHQFAHLESSLVTVGQRVKRGDPIGIIGFTGYTIPSGENGRHCHWWILNDNGTYTYPPNLVNETFISNQGGSNVILTAEDAKTLYRRIFNREGDAGGIKNYTGKTLDFALKDMIGGQEFKNLHVKTNTVTVEKIVERVVEKPVEIIKEVIVEKEIIKEVPISTDTKWETFKSLIRELFK